MSTEDCFSANLRAGTIALNSIDMLEPTADIQKCRMAAADFFSFVERTYAELCRIESRVNGGGKSPLSVFCRLDIGLIADKTGKVPFAVIFQD